VHQPSATAAVTGDTLLPFDLPAVRSKKLTVDFDGGNQSSDGGLLSIPILNRHPFLLMRPAFRLETATGATRVDQVRSNLLDNRNS
jgi:hypothetical protein